MIVRNVAVRISCRSVIGEAMGPAKGPTLRAQWLGKQLREYRERAGLTLIQAGEHLQRDKGTVSRIEAGIRPCRASDAMALLHLYGVDDPRVRDGIDRLCRDVWCKGWWDDYAAEAETKIVDHAWLEARASGIRLFHTTVFPGLLQTEEYSRSVIRAAAPEMPDEQVDLWVGFRMNRQRVLERREAPSLNVILDEAVIRRFSDGQIMRRQLLYLLEGMLGNPRVTVRVLPFSAGPHASPDSPFTILDLPKPYASLAQVETRTGAVYLEGEDMETYGRIYAGLEVAALSPDESRAMIALTAANLL